MKKIIGLLIVFSIFITTLTPVSAQEELKLPGQTIYPGSVSYPLKRAWEKFRENLPFGSKVDLYKDLVLARAAELDYVVSKKQLNEFQTSTERFSYFAGKLTESAQNADQQTKENIKNDFKNYEEKLNQLETNVEYGTSYWMLLEHSKNSLEEYSSKLSQ